MANKRVSELATITDLEIQPSDLFLLTDVSAVESKRLVVGELTTYLQRNITGSLTASLAKSASYLIYNGSFNGTASNAVTASYNISSSYADKADSASYATTASYAFTSSLALTASYYSGAYLNDVESASYAKTASIGLWANTASYLYFDGVNPNGTAYNSIYSQTSNYLIYSGGNNGTASYAMSASRALSASLADRASYLVWNGPTTNNGTASWASSSIKALNSNTASYLYYNNNNNGTASYAMNSRTASFITLATRAITASYADVAGNTNGVQKLYGPYTISFTNNTASFSILPTSAIEYPNVIYEIVGDFGIPLRQNPTSDGYIELIASSAMVLGGLPFSVLNSYAHGQANISGAGSLTHSLNLKTSYSNLQSGITWSCQLKTYNCNCQNNKTTPRIWIYSSDLTGFTFTSL